MGRDCAGQVDHMIVNNEVCYDKEKIANEFCNYFNEKPNILVSNILPPIGDYTSLVPLNQSSIFLYYSTPSEVEYYICSSKKRVI